MWLVINLNAEKTRKKQSDAIPQIDFHFYMYF